MNVEIRIPGRLYDAAWQDLKRPHPFAAERIGFFSTALGRIEPGHVVIIVTRFHSIPDSDYEHDPFVGARIGSMAIRTSLQRVLDDGAGQLHVHLHDFRGVARPSPTDLEDVPRLIDSFAATGPACGHGALILSRTSAWSAVRVPGAPQAVVASKITVVGFPVKFLKR